MPQNAIELLKQDHRKVKELLEQLLETTDRAQKKRQTLLDRIEHELEVHTSIEEEIFYPAFRDADGKEHAKMYFEAREEHRAVEQLVIPDLKKTDTAGNEFAGRAKVLRELVEHHIQDEEQEMFPQAEATMDDETLQELGQQMEERRKQIRKK